MLFTARKRTKSKKQKINLLSPEKVYCESSKEK